MLLGLTCLKAQKKFTNPEKAEQLKKTFTEEKVVAEFSNSAYRFEIKGDELKINAEDRIKLISLRSNVKYARSIYYNDHIEVLIHAPHGP